MVEPTKKGKKSTGRMDLKLSTAFLSIIYFHENNHED